MVNISLFFIQRYEKCVLANRVRIAHQHDGEYNLNVKVIGGHVVDVVLHWMETIRNCIEDQVSITPTFYTHLFHMKVNFFSYVRFCNFFPPKFCTRKMLMKLTAGVNFTNILLPTFCTKVFCAAYL